MNKHPRTRTMSTGNDCVVCAHPIDVYAVGHCDHVICFKCSTKMRLLCKEKYCPVCRKELKKVIFSSNKNNFVNLNAKRLIKETRYNLNVFFTDAATETKFIKLLEHQCQICPNRPPDTNFQNLKSHIRKEHGMYHCEICLEHNRNFTSEYKVYSRKDLATHKRVGDANDRSHKGHPLCKFCDERYLDDDKLFHHLRTEHFYCHLCEHLHSNDFYDNYIELRKHFKSDHFLCEIANCKNEEFTSVFSSEIDLKAHCAVAHKDMKSKQQQKQDRQINLGFQYTRRPPPASRGRRPHNPHRSAAAFEDSNDMELAAAMSLSMKDVAPAPTEPDAPVTKDQKPPVKQEPAQPSLSNLIESNQFPGLGDTASAAPPKPIPAVLREKKPEAAAAPLWTPKSNYPLQSNSTNDFPALSQPTTKPKPFLQPQAVAKKPTKQKQPPQSAPNLNSRQNTNSASLKSEDDFPSFSKPKQPLQKGPNWKSRQNVNSTILKSEEDFPSLGGTAKPVAPWKTQQNSVIKKTYIKPVAVHNKTSTVNANKKKPISSEVRQKNRSVVGYAGNSNEEYSDSFVTTSQNFHRSDKSSLTRMVQDTSLLDEPAHYELGSNITVTKQQPVSKPAMKQKAFTKEEQDFPALYASGEIHWAHAEPVYRHNIPSHYTYNDHYPSNSHTDQQQNGTDLKLSNIFDFPSL
uniref:E3 ubiquitin-protein ligase ZNF598 n=1 Tax=Ciona intestinalis TaxID=7719 RepID=UPI000180CCA9|nr:E3 ubiquitin-protein ligase ZNF598 [Ciona intestinalis]|eukprot:XP_002131152.1 E3 ubiquitin-protein ligase ZNF598 [Ciona intestinalis]